MGEIPCLIAGKKPVLPSPIIANVWHGPEGRGFNLCNLLLYPYLKPLSPLGGLKVIHYPSSGLQLGRKGRETGVVNFCRAPILP